MVGTYQFPKSVRSELPAWNCSSTSLSSPCRCTASVSMTATSLVTARTRSRQVSGSFMWYSTPRYSTTSNCPSSSRSTFWKSATTGSTFDPNAAEANSNPRRPGRSGRQKSVSSRDWSGRVPLAMHSAQ